MKLIDFRARPNTRTNMDLYGGSANDFFWRRWGYKPPVVEYDEFLGDLDAAGVDYSVFTGRQMMNADGEVTFGLSNDYVAEGVARRSDRMVGFAGIDISAGKAALREIDRAVNSLGMRGISIDPKRSGILPNDREAYPVFEKAREHKIPVAITVGPIVGKYGDPELLDVPALDFPDVNFVFSHAVWPQTKDFLAVAYRRPNVYLEPSIYWNLPGTDDLFAAANGFLSDQVIYASGFPFAPLNSADLIRDRYDWSDENWRKFTVGNAARLLGLTKVS